MPHRKEGNNEWKKWKKEEWEHYFRQHGVTEPLPNLQGTIVERAQEAAHFLTRNGFITFSGIDLVGLSNLNTLTPETSGGKLAVLYAAIAKKYADKKVENIPAIQQLRMGVGAYQGNLHTFLGYRDSAVNGLAPFSSEVYPHKIKGMEVSDEDWQSGIRLPEHYSTETARLFGYYWGAGALMHHNDATKVSTVCISVRQEKAQVLEKRISPLIEKVHNITPKHIHKKGESTKSFGPNYTSDCLFIHSRALSTYLHNEHDMPLPKVKRGTTRRIRKQDLPSLSWNAESIESFTIGLLEVRGRVQGEQMFLQGTGAYGDALVDLLHAQNYCCSSPQRKEGQDVWYIAFGKETSRALQHKMPFNKYNY